MGCKVKKYIVEIYQDRRGISPIINWLSKLNSRMKFDISILNKFYYQVERLEIDGNGLGKPISKKIKGYDLYELRPVPYRVFYGALKGYGFVLLHSFRKQSDKTPKKEIEKATGELEDWIERKGDKNVVERIKKRN